MLQALQAAQLHFQNRLCLYFGQCETLHQTFFCVVIASTNDTNHFVYIFNGNAQTFEYMRAFLGFFQIKACASGDNSFLMFEVFRKYLLQIQYDRFAVYQRNHNHAKTFLQLCIFIELIEYDIGIDIFFQFYNDLNIIASGSIIQIADAFDAFFFDQFAYFFNQTQFIDHIGNFCDDDFFFAACHRLDFCQSTYHNFAASGAICRTDAAFAQYGRACREVRTFDIFHQFLNGGFFARDAVIYHTCQTVQHFTQIMGWDIGRHTNRNP